MYSLWKPFKSMLFSILVSLSLAPSFYPPSLRQSILFFLKWKCICTATNAPIPAVCGGFHTSRDISNTDTVRQEESACNYLCGYLHLHSWASTLKCSVSVCKAQWECDMCTNYNELIGAANGSVNITWVCLWSFWNMCIVTLYFSSSMVESALWLTHYRSL